MVPAKDSTADDIIKDVGKNRDKLPNISRLEKERRRRLGREVDTVKVYCLDPDVVQKYAAQLSKISDVIGQFEADVRLASRYLIDYDISPSSWLQVGCEEIDSESGIRVSKTYLATDRPQPAQRNRPKLRILAFSTIAIGERGSAKPRADPVRTISAVTSTGALKSFIVKGDEDSAILKEFIQFVQREDPDIIAGFGNNTIDWPYLSERSKIKHIRLEVDRSGSEPHTSLYGHVSITGRANLDAYNLISDINEIKVKTIENAAKFLGIGLEKDPVQISEQEYLGYWKDESRRKLLVKLCERNARYVLGITERMLEFAIAFSALTGIPLDHVATAAVGFRVEWYLMREAFKIKELIPQRREQPYFRYAGGIVLQPKVGLHENVAVLDFASMYPNLIMLYNLSPDTLVPPNEKVQEEKVHRISEVKYRFRREPPGLYKLALSKLLASRSEIQKQQEKLDPSTDEFRILKEREKALKLIANACYGYAGWIGARWYVREVAEAATALGRETIRKVIHWAEDIGLRVIYGDTDAIFVDNEERKVERLLARVRRELKMEIRPDTVYSRVLFTEAKKRYAGLLPDGSLDIVGLEVVRGDWSEIAKKVQEQVLELVLKERSAGKAVDYVRKVTSDLEARLVPIEDLTIWKTLTKEIEEYKVRAPHIEVARKLISEGWDLGLGDKVGFVIVKGPGKLFQKAAPYMTVNLQDVDTEYYLKHQIVPAAARVLEQFGVAEENLLAGG